MAVGFDLALRWINSPHEYRPPKIIDNLNLDCLVGLRMDLQHYCPGTGGHSMFGQATQETNYSEGRDLAHGKWSVVTRGVNEPGSQIRKPVMDPPGAPSRCDRTSCVVAPSTNSRNLSKGD